MLTTYAYISNYKDFLGIYFLKRGDFMAKINDLLCGIILPLFIAGCGVFLGIRLRFFYIFKPLKAIKDIFSGGGSFRFLCLALAGTLGVGNIVGVSSAILVGGYGSIFWMWISAILSMGIKYYEVYLSMLSQRRKNGALHGGAPYYIYDGFSRQLGKRLAFVLGALFSLFCVINSFTTGNIVQINSISTLFPINKILFGIIFCVLVFLVVFKGTKSISLVNSILMPILTILYILMCLFVLFINFDKIPYAFSLILKSAFSLKSAAGGVIGFGILRGIRYGVSRGLLSNEAGCGTSPLAHASSNATPHAQSCLGILEVFIDTIVLCTMTALVIIVSGAIPCENALDFVLNAFSGALGNFGKYGVLIASVLFAFATVCTQYFYGKESLLFISNARWLQLLYAILFFAIIILGAIMPIYIMWQISDLAIATMTIFNLTCVAILHKKVKK